MKRVLLTLFFAVSLVLFISFSASASTQDFEHKLNKYGGITITKYVGSESYVEIPEQIDGYEVTEIGSSAFELCSTLKSIELPDTVTTIGQNAFSYCSSLNEIDFPGSLTVIDYHAFKGCTSIKEIYLPASVKEVSFNAFYGCENLEKVTINSEAKFSSVGDGAFGACPKLQSAGPIGGGYDIEFSWNTTVPSGVFYKCHSLKSIVLPSGITKIGNSAFELCSVLNKVYFLGSLPDFGSKYSSAFKNNSEQLTLYYLNGALGFDSPTLVASDGNTYKTEIFKTKDYTTHWGKDAIIYVIENNLIDLVDENEFQPNEALSRKALVIALAKLSGVTSDHIQWAIDIGLLQGYGNGNYGENDPVNREQLCVFIERYLILEDYNINTLKSNQKSTFADDSIISSWAKECIYDMQEISIINGRPGNVFDPKAQPTRAEGATVLHKLKLLLEGKTKCKHIYSDKQLVPESEVWVKKDDESHTLVSAQYVNICTICGKEVLSTNNENVSEHHIFDVAGKCIANGCDAFRFESLIDGDGDVVAGLGDYTATGTSKAKDSEFHIEYSVNGIPVHNTASNAQVTVQIDDMLIIQSFNGTVDVSPSANNEYYYGTINDSIFVSPMTTLVMLNKPGVNTIELLTSSSNETLATLTVIVIGDTYDTRLIEKTDYIRNTNSQFTRTYDSLNTNEFGAYFSSCMYSFAKLRPDEMLAKGWQWITQGDETYENAIKQALITSYSDEDAKEVLSVVELFYNCTAYTEKGIDFFLQSVDAMPDDLSSVFHTADSWLSLVDISINAQQLRQYTIDQYFTASVMAMNYESNCEVLNNLIKNAADEKTKKVYENVKKDMAAYQRNVITRFLAVASDTPKGLLCDVYTSAVSSGMTITQTTIPDVFKKMGAGGGYVLAHSITSLLADVVFKGEIMYESLVNIHIANRILPLLIQDYDSALYNYSLKPNEKNKSTVIATAKILGNYRIWALENCKTHLDSLVIQKLIVPDEIEVYINSIELEKTSIQKVIEELDTFK